jgi:hypothetical protein
VTCIAGLTPNLSEYHYSVFSGIVMTIRLHGTSAASLIACGFARNFSGKVGEKFAMVDKRGRVAAY